MSKLLRANFICLWKNGSFWSCMAFVVVAACFMVVVEAEVTSPEAVLFEGAVYVSMIFFIFICSIIGMDYNDGTIRNKIVAGHSRETIYFANLIVCVAVSIIMYLLWIILIAVFAAVKPWWNFEMPFSKMLPAIFYCFAALISYTAIFVLICMLVGKRSESIVVSFLLMVLLFIIAGRTCSVLEQPEYYVTMAESSIDENGEEQMEIIEREKNPRYVRGVTRMVYQFLNDFLPSCQICSISSKFVVGMDDMSDAYNNMNRPSEYIQQEENRITPLLYSLLLIVLTNFFGIYFFRRKNLK